MERLPSREVLNLQPARKTRRDNDRVRIGRPKRRKQPLFADEPGDFVVLFFVAERPRHAAAAGVEIDNLRARDAPQQPHRWFHADQGTLMTVALHEDSLRTGLKSRHHLLAA